MDCPPNPARGPVRLNQTVAKELGSRSPPWILEYDNEEEEGGGGGLR